MASAVDAQPRLRGKSKDRMSSADRTFRLSMNMFHLVLDDIIKQHEERPLGPAEHDAVAKLEQAVHKVAVATGSAKGVSALPSARDSSPENPPSQRGKTPQDQASVSAVGRQVSPEQPPSQSTQAPRDHSSVEATSAAYAREPSTPPPSARARRTSKLKKSRSMASSATCASSNRQLIDAFTKIDADGGGTISADELRLALDAVGVPRARAQLLLNSADKDRNGEIDFDEWLYAVTHGPSRGEFSRLSQHMQKMTAPELLAYSSSATGKLEVPPPWYMMRPDSGKRLAWDVFLILVCLYIAVMMPFQYGFEPAMDKDIVDSLRDVELVVDVIFLIDVIINFFTGVIVRDMTVKMEFQYSAVNYLKSWFFLDVISSIPIDRIVDTGKITTRPLKLLKIPKIAKIIKFVMPMYTGHSELFNTFEYAMSSPGLRHFLRRSNIVVLTMILCHWMACCMALTSLDWLMGYQDVSDSPFRLYLAAVYWSTMTMTTVGYGDIIATSDNERVFSLVGMILGAGYYGYAVGTISSIVSASDLSQSSYHERMDALYDWLNHHQLPREMRKRIVRYMKTFLHEKSAVNEADIMHDLPPTLQTEVGQVVIHEDIRSNPLFDDLPINAVTKLQKIVQKLTCEDGGAIVQDGESGTAMFIVHEGQVTLEWMTGGQPQQEVLKAGDSFGEEILGGLEERYYYSATAMGLAKLYMIEEGEFQELFTHMPDVLAKVKRNAQKSRLYHLKMSGIITGSRPLPGNDTHAIDSRAVSEVAHHEYDEMVTI